MTAPSPDADPTAESERWKAAALGLAAEVGDVRKWWDEDRVKLARARRWIETCVDPVAVGPERKRAMLDYLDGSAPPPDFETSSRRAHARENEASTRPGQTC